MSKNSGYKVEYKGVVYDKAKECLLALGVSEARYYSICSKMGGLKDTEEVVNIDDIMQKVLKYSNSMDARFDFKVNYNGHVYTSIIDYCRASGFPFDIVIYKLKMGMTPEDSIKEADYRTRRNFVFRGKQYKDIKTCLQEYNVPISVGVVTTRMKKLRVTVQDALEFQISRMEEGAYDGFDYEGMHFSTLAEASRTLGLDVDAVQRVKNNLRLENPELTNMEVLDYIINEGRPTLSSRRVKYRGVTYPNLTAVCLKYNLNVNKVRTYIAKNLDKSLEEVMDYFVDGAVNFRVGDTGYATLPDACNAIGITVSDVFKQRRLNPQMSLQDVLNMYSAKKEIE